MLRTKIVCIVSAFILFSCTRPQDALQEITRDNAVEILTFWFPSATIRFETEKDIYIVLERERVMGMADSDIEGSNCLIGTADSTLFVLVKEAEKDNRYVIYFKGLDLTLEAPSSATTVSIL